MKIGIIGGGIGGLAAALTLTQAGIEAEVYERAPALQDLGAGITLAPNATRVLYHLGLGPAIEATALHQQVTEYRHYRTKEVLHCVDSGKDRPDAPHLRTHRWDLQTAMVERLAETAPAALRLGWQVADLAQGPQGVTLRFPGHPDTTVDAVIAADGIRSGIRQGLFNPAPPVFSGFVAWRTLVATAKLAPHLLGAVVACGQGRHLFRYQVRRGQLLNLVAFARRNDWTEEGWAIPASLPEFLAEYQDYDDETQAIIAHPVEGQLFKWGLFVRPWLDTWHDGRIALLGDAAHPMLPFQGQGAAMAIEDAMILARCLTAETSVTKAFTLYQATRSGRVRAVTQRAASQGNNYEGEPTAARLKGDDRRSTFIYDAVTAPLGG